jgi:hypothetical protein
MAEVTYTNVANQKFTYTGISASDTGQEITMDGGIGLLCSVQVLDGGGTGFNAGTLTIQISNDNTNWATLKDVHGTDAAATADSMFELSTGAQYMRPLADASIGDVDVIFSFG